jgi:hypothetical protein
LAQVSAGIGNESGHALGVSWRAKFMPEKGSGIGIGNLSKINDANKCLRF